MRSISHNSPLFLMLLVLGVYLLTMSGHTYSPDEETMLETSRQLVTHGSWAIPQSRSLVEVPGLSGRRYSQYGPGQSFAAVPWVGAGLLVGGAFPKSQVGYPLRLVLGSYNALIAAGICGLLAALGLALGYSRRASLVVGGALAFSTFLWPHSRTFFSEPLTALLLLGAFYLLHRSREQPGINMVLSGALFALALATKVQYAVALPAFLLYVLWPGKRSGDSLRASLKAGLLWGAGFAAGLVPLMLYNWSAFGNPLLTGYGTDLKSTFRTPLLEGVYGLLVSPGKGLLWFALPVLLSVWGFRRFARAHRAEAAFILVLSASIITLFALYTFWHGDGSWGPRYLLPLLPFVLLPGLPILEMGCVRSTLGRLFRFATAALLALGFLVNLMGVLVNFDTYINVGYDDATRHFVGSASPIVGHARLLGQRLSSLDLPLLHPSDKLVFKSGFSYSEGDKTANELLPRWTTGQAVMQVWPDLSHGPLLMTLRLSDNRPPDMSRATLALLTNGQPVAPSAAAVPGMPVTTDYAFPISSSPTLITVQSDTWNPQKAGVAERNEELGLKLESISVTEGGTARVYSMADTSPPPPYYPQPRWYYDPGTPHLADLWPIYMAETGMGRKAMLALGLPLVLVGAVCMTLGLLGLRRGAREVGHTVPVIS